MDINRFKQLLESTIGNVKPLIVEANYSLTFDSYLYPDIKDKSKYVLMKGGQTNFVQAVNGATAWGGQLIFSCKPYSTKEGVNFNFLYKNKQYYSSDFTTSFKQRFCAGFPADTQGNYGTFSVDPPKDKKSIKEFQKWVINTKKDQFILGKGGDTNMGDDGIFGPKTTEAWKKYGKDYTDGQKTNFDGGGGTGSW